MESNSLVKSITTPQFYYDIHPSERFQGLCRILDMYMGKMVIIFCRTKKDVDHLSEKLNLLNYGVESYHGDLSPNNKDKVLKKFADKNVTTLLVTDIPNNIEAVVGIDLVLFSIIPQDPDSYIQKIVRLESILTLCEVATLITQNEFKKLAFIKRVTKSTILQKQFLDAIDIIKKKKDRLIDKIKNVKLDDVNSDILQYTKDILNDFDAEFLVYSLLRLGFKSEFDINAYKIFSQLSKPSKNDDDNADRLFIALGKADGINNDSLSDFLYKETNIDKNHFSDFKIFETFSFFMVPADDAEVILEIFRRKKRGKRSIVERAKGKDSSSSKKKS